MHRHSVFPMHFFRLLPVKYRLKWNFSGSVERSKIFWSRLTRFARALRNKSQLGWMAELQSKNKLVESYLVVGVIIAIIAIERESNIQNGRLRLLIGSPLLLD